MIIIIILIINLGKEFQQNIRILEQLFLLRWVCSF
jgi:hypothetical protein